MARVKYQVFVSSTFSDLREERERVTWEILKARHIPAGMENFPSTDDRGWKIIERTILDSDYYVLLLAGRYGSVDPDGMSWTEREYDFARARNIPVLAFVREQSAITGNNVETGDGAARLHAFVRKVREAHLNSAWTTGEDLAGKVASALNRAIQDAEDDDTPRAGWVRGNTVPRNVSDEIARLSKENSELRALVAGQVSRPQLVLFRNGKPVTEIELCRPRYQANIAHLGGRKVGPPSGDEQTLDYHNRSLWLDFGVRNEGNGVARRVRAEFVIDGAEVVMFDRVLARILPMRQRWYADRSHPPYMTKHSHEGRASSGKAITIEQHVPDIGIDRTEEILGMRLAAPQKALEVGVFHFRVTYRVDTEDGAKTEGVVEIAVRLEGEEMFNVDSLKDETEIERIGF